LGIIVFSSLISVKLDLFVGVLPQN
jgi:hypothetical protein